MREPTVGPKTHGKQKRRVNSELSTDDAELIAYYQSQRANTNSPEWAACLDAMLRNLRPAAPKRSEG